MNTYTTFYLARHGQTDWNVENKMHGHSDIPLNKKGEKQANELKKKLEKISIDEVFTSDLLRAKRTAEIATLEKKLAVQTSIALREAHMGKFEGKNADDFFPLYRKWIKLSEKERIKHKKCDDLKSVEDSESVVSRFITFLRETAVSHPGKNILVVTHGGIITNFLVHLGFAPEEKIYVKNTALITVKSDGIDFDVVNTEGVGSDE